MHSQCVCGVHWMRTIFLDAHAREGDKLKTRFDMQKKPNDRICNAFYRNLLRLNSRLQSKFKCSNAVWSNQLKCRFCKNTRYLCVCHYFQLRRFWMCSSSWCGWRLTMMRKRNELWGNQLTQFRCNWKKFEVNATAVIAAMPHWQQIAFNRIPIEWHKCAKRKLSKEKPSSNVRGKKSEITKKSLFVVVDFYFCGTMDYNMARNRL